MGICSIDRERKKSVLFFSVAYLTRVHFVEVNKYYGAP